MQEFKTIQLSSIAAIVVALAALLRPSAAEPAPAAAQPAPHLAAYRWAMHPENVDAFGKWIGDERIWAEDFTDISAWDNIENPGWLLVPWGEWVRARPGRKLILSIPLLPGGWDRSGPTGGTIDLKTPVSLENGAAGKYNHHFQVLARSLVKNGLQDSIIRLGWEFNGGWYTWRAVYNPDAMAEYWRQIVRTMRAVPGAEHLAFCFNPALGYQQFPAEKAWPGDEFVDYVGLDVYDESWAKDTYPWPADASPADIDARHRKVWNSVLYGGDHGLRFWSAFAADHHKPMAIPEWGVSDREDKHGGLDDPFFIEQMHAFIADARNNVAFHSYFDVQASDGHHQLSPGVKEDEKTQFPRSAERFKALFAEGK